MAGLTKRLMSPTGALPALRDLATDWLAANEYMSVGAPAVTGHAPALATEAAALGRAVSHFRSAVRLLLSTHRAAIAEPWHQMQAARLADMAIDLFAWMATLSRASESAARVAAGGDGAGLEHELQVARLSMRHAAERFAVAHREVVAGEHVNGDAATMSVAKATLKAGRYLPDHPLRV